MKLNTCRWKKEILRRNKPININGYNQLLASLLASFPCKINTFRKRVRNVVTSKGIQVGIEIK